MYFDFFVCEFVWDKNLFFLYLLLWWDGSVWIVWIWRGGFVWRKGFVCLSWGVGMFFFYGKFWLGFGLFGSYLFWMWFWEFFFVGYDFWCLWCLYVLWYLCVVLDYLILELLFGKIWEWVVVDSFLVFVYVLICLLVWLEGCFIGDVLGVCCWVVMWCWLGF